jgi:hypothetical protein
VEEICDGKLLVGEWRGVDVEGAPVGEVVEGVDEEMEEGGLAGAGGAGDEDGAGRVVGGFEEAEELIDGGCEWVGSGGG